MKKSTKGLLITGALLILFGIIIFTGVMAANHWDFSKLSTVQLVSSTYQVDDKFDDISLKTDVEDIIFLPSDDGKCRVVCDEPKNVKAAVSVQGKTLTINTTDNEKKNFYIGIMLNTPKISVYLPEREYSLLRINENTGDIKLPDAFTFGKIDIEADTANVKCRSSASDSIKIKLSTGDMDISDLSANSLDLTATTGEIKADSISCKSDIQVKVSTGDSKFTDISCKNFISKGSTGEIFLTDVIAAEKISIERSTGDVAFNACDAGDIFFKTTTGNINGILLSDKIFITETNTGNVSVPKSLSGDKCEVHTTTGDIEIKTK